MTPTRFLGLFWLSFLAAVATSVTLIRVFIIPTVASPFLKPELPLPGVAYVSAYRTDDVDHQLFKFGLFGFGVRIKDADIIIIGSSRAECGISAAQLAEALSRVKNRPIRAVNLGLGHAEGIGFARSILERHGVFGKMLVIDLFSGVPDGAEITPYGRSIDSLDVAQAYQKIGQVWAEFLRDWLADGLLPRAHLSAATGIRWERAMSLTLTRRWDTGDVIDSWRPLRGSVFLHPTDGILFPFSAGVRSPELVALPKTAVERFRERRIRPIAVLMPYPDSDTAKASREAAASAVPFIDIPRDGMLTFDDSHLAAVSRQAVTARLAGELAALVRD